MLRSLAPLLLVGLLTTTMAGCGDDTPVAPTTVQAQTFLDVYKGELATGSSSFYSFAVNAPGMTAVTLGSLIDVATGRAIDSALEVGIGIPAGDGCHVTNAVTVSSGLSAQLLQPLTSGVYCVRLRDVGQLRVLVAFGVRISHT